MSKLAEHAREIRNVLFVMWSWPHWRGRDKKNTCNSVFFGLYWESYFVVQGHNTSQVAASTRVVALALRLGILSFAIEVCRFAWTLHTLTDALCGVVLSSFRAARDWFCSARRALVPSRTPATALRRNVNAIGGVMRATISIVSGGP